MSVATVVPHCLVGQNIPVYNNCNYSKEERAEKWTPHTSEVGFNICVITPKLLRRQK